MLKPCLRDYEFKEPLQERHEMGKRILERRKRGFLGWTMLSIFWLANGFMLLWLLAALGKWGKIAKIVPEGDKQAFGLEVTIGLKYIFFIWACVAIVTGILACTTRGPKEIIETDT